MSHQGGVVSRPSSDLIDLDLKALRTEVPQRNRESYASARSEKESIATKRARTYLPLLTRNVTRRPVSLDLDLVFLERLAVDDDADGAVSELHDLRKSERGEGEERK